MAYALVIRVRFHDGRYQGAGNWPPSPARLFQALVAAAGLYGELAATRTSLEWLESRPSAPIIGAPNARGGQRVMFYMPNNDLDTVQGDVRRFAEIRTAKKIFSPWLFDAAVPLVYVWQDVDDADARHAEAIVALSDKLYQLGRGIDMAWAWGELLDSSGVEEVLASYAGKVFRPCPGGNGITLDAPRPGSLASIKTRYEAYRHRFQVERKGSKVQLTFRQPPRPRFRPVGYDSPPFRRVYELRAPSGGLSFASWPPVGVSKLVVGLRNRAVERLGEIALPARRQEIERVLVGRRPDGSNDGPTSERVKIVPLLSIGHPHADRAIRRVLVEVPAGSSLRADDLDWAFSGIEPVDPETGEVYPVVLTPASADNMLAHYGIDQKHGGRTWRTVTPAALPEAVRRPRIESALRPAEAQGGNQRVEEQRRTAAAVVQALRHADVPVRVESLRVQREPFDGGGSRAEAFAADTRFPMSRLWHVEITFASPVSGPLVIGDGRFLGLGLMAPVKKVQGIHALAVVDGLAARARPAEVARALRRAVMAIVQVHMGKEKLPTFFSGHASDGSPTRAANQHLAFAFDPTGERLLVIAPHVFDRRAPSQEERHWLAVLDESLKGLHVLRAGSAGLLTVAQSALDPVSDALLAPSRVWETVTPYCVTRHAKHVAAAEALSMDLRAECRNRGLPKPMVTPYDLQGVPGLGLVGGVRLAFEVAVTGPIALGKTRHLGGGLFSGRPQAQ